jgi:hypothetical protein
MAPVKTSPADVAKSDANFLGSYRMLVDHVDGAALREFGPVMAFTTRLPLATFNGVMVLRPSGPREVGAALDWIATFQVPCRLWAREDLAASVAEVAAAAGLVSEAQPMPGMLLRPVPMPPPPAPGVSTETIDSLDGLRRYRGIIEGQGVSPDVAARLIPDSVLADPDVILVAASLDGHPVATALAFRTGDTAGVYNVGTLAAARRRGVGTAVTWRAVEAAHAWRSERVVLQSSAMGEPVYRAMGFREVVSYRIFRLARPPA